MQQWQGTESFLHPTSHPSFVSFVSTSVMQKGSGQHAQVSDAGCVRVASTKQEAVEPSFELLG